MTSEKSKTLQPPLPSKNPKIKPTQSHLLVISFEDGSQSFLFSILSSFIKNLLINKIAEGRGTLLASLISHWMLTGYWVMNRSKRKRLWLTTSKRNTHRFFKRWQFGPKLWWIFLIRWWMDGQNLPRQSLFWAIMVSNMWFLKFIYCGVGEVGGLFNPQFQ